MTNQVPKYVTRVRASLLLGMTEAELSRIAKESGLGRSERAGDEEETYFTYEELQRIRMVMTNQGQAAPENRIEDLQVKAGSSGPREASIKKRTDGCVLPERFGEIQFLDIEN
jgi:hypothetical protein